MKRVLFRSMLLLFVVGAFGACEEKDSGELSYEELQRQLEQMRLILENNTKIVNVSFVGDEMVLTFATGETINTSIPANVIPQIGSNGNWWINGVDLGVSAEGKAPTIGSNGNWWIGTEDTGVKAEGVKGDQGEKGEQGEKGNGIATITYDPETAILKITLDDGSFYQFVMGATGDGNIGGNLIGDLNGEFLLTSITNGDLPFITLSYDDANNLTHIDYYTNILNAPERRAGLTQVYGTNGRVATHRLTEYAETDKVLPVSDVFENREYYYEDHSRFLVRFSALQLYRELFPSGFKDIVYGDIFIEYFVTNCWHSYQYLYNTDYVYRWYDKSGNDYLVYKYPRQIFFIWDEWYVEDRKCILASDNGQNYFYLPYNSYEYYGDEKNDKKGDWYWSYTGEAYNLSDIWISWYDETHFMGDIVFGPAQDMMNSFDNISFRVKAEPYTGKADVITGKKLDNYFAPKANEIINPDNLTGNYKALYCEYMMYEKGDEIQGAEVNYAYTDSDIKASFEGNEVVNLVMENNKLKSAIVVEADGQRTEVLSFTYSGDKLSSIGAPYADAQEVAKFTYDTRGNLTEMSVHSGKLEGKGMESTLYTLGLITTYTYYNEELGRVVYGYKYSTDYVPLLRLSYNYGYKNFMNHTLVAANPIVSLFEFENAIEEVNWAGHGSCLFAEYSHFNEGGYPERIKGIFHYSPLNTSGNGDYPVNGAVAGLYKLNYEKKK
ncbi:MAG: hypothetical protein LIP08_10630 [Bacteroides sp.]|nr:hypothetical protein [Bacteroides sp.]